MLEMSVWRQIGNVHKNFLGTCLEENNVPFAPTEFGTDKSVSVSRESTPTNRYRQ